MSSNIGPRVARFCPYCGTLLIEGARFCPYCGSLVLRPTDSPGEPQPGLTATAGPIPGSSSLAPTAPEPTSADQVDESPVRDESASRQQRHVWVFIVSLATVITAIAAVLALIIH